MVLLGGIFKRGTYFFQNCHGPQALAQKEFKKKLRESQKSTESYIALFPFRIIKLVIIWNIIQLRFIQPEGDVGSYKYIISLLLKVGLV